MTKSEIFLEFIDKVLSEYDGDIPEDVTNYLNAIRNPSSEKEKPAVTDNGKLIITFLKESTISMLKARDIAENIGIASKTVSGAMRKLVVDGFVEKVGKDPVIYSITEKGRNIEF